ncbi:hypothetical protein QF050_003547 [Arthrobacter sp. SLBN-112]|nr:hypothetical protein [Arthrobacter sp. SLBN-112]
MDQQLQAEPLPHGIQGDGVHVVFRLQALQ